MRTALLLFSLVVIAPLMLSPVAAGPPGADLVDGECVWVINGPTIFSRYCVEPGSRQCRVYHEQWYWEGGYRKTCFL